MVPAPARRPHLQPEAAPRGCASAQRPARRVGLWQRFLKGIFDADQHQAEVEVARYLEHTGGRLTDDIERRITERFLTGEWPSWR